VKCEATPDLRESFRRGFNAGVAETKRVLEEAVRDTRLHRIPEVAK
jgi:hypothetical protein